MAKTYLGYGYTNENGVATLDFDAEDNPLPKKSYQCQSRTASVVAEASVNNIVTSSENIRFCEGYVPSESLTLTADKNILSYVDNDTVTLTATYDGTTIEGKSVVFKLGSRVLDTVVTDSEGVAEYEYTSQGAGDVVFTAKCSGLTETITIEDCLYTQISEISQVSSQTGTDLCVLLDNDLSLDLSSMDFEFSVDAKTDINGSRLLLGSKQSVSSTNYSIGSNRDSSRISAVYRDTSTSVWGTSYTRDNNYHSFKFVKENSSFTAYVDNTSQGSQSLSWWSDYSDYTLYFDCWQSGTIYVKNLKIKPL